MSLSILTAVVLGLGLPALALPSTQYPNIATRLNTTNAYTVPAHDKNLTARNEAIQVKRETFLYGPSIAGNTSFWPTGSLGNSTVQSQFASLVADGNSQVAAVKNDSATAAQAVIAAGGITKLSDFDRLYDGQWKNAIPDGLVSGILSNYTDDLLFSMERLSLNPYSIKRLNPTSDKLAFDIDESIALSITGMTTQSLLASGSLFYIDQRFQADLESTGRYAAACDAFFYISSDTGDFLPLAVRTNVGENLIYTPLDLPNDWLLAKIMFNLNDFWHSQFYHFAGTHMVAEIVYEAAYRTLSDSHPVLALLNRLTPQLFSYRQAALATLINKGGYVDNLFAYTGAAAAVTTTILYNEMGAGNFQANYFLRNLENRGLLNSSFGPELKSFPFYEDASAIHTSITKFVSTFVDSYYPTTTSFESDNELQSWISEAIPAQILDFPTSMTRQTLIEIITHIAFLGSAAHQTLNTNDVAEAMAVLPFHPVSLYAPPPTSKGVTDLIPFLPGVAASIGQISVTALFSRPTFLHSERSLTQMFNSVEMLARMPPGIKEAAETFTGEMMVQSGVVSSRGFDERGLCQGMPFKWKALDPQRAPYYFTI